MLLRNVKLITSWIFVVGACVTLPAPMFAQSFNVDLGDEFGTPDVDYAAASGQAGYWNEVVVEQRSLEDLGEEDSGVTIEISATGDGHATANGDSNDVRLLGDQIYGMSDAPWEVHFHGLLNGFYNVYVYAPQHTMGTGEMSVQGQAFTTLPGNPGAELIEGNSWAVKEMVLVDDGELSISGMPGSISFAGLAGVQLVYSKIFEDRFESGMSE